MTNTNPARETQINNRCGQIHSRLPDIAAVEANAARVGEYGSKCEFNPQRHA